MSIGMAANGFSLIFFQKFSSFVNLRSFMIEYNMLLYYLFFFIQGRTHCLRFLFSFIYVLGSVTNHPNKLLTILSICCYLCPPFFEINRVFYIFALKNVYF